MALERAAEHEDKQVRMLDVDYDRVDSMAKAKAKAGAKVSRREKNGRRAVISLYRAWSVPECVPCGGPANRTDGRERDRRLRLKRQTDS
jgi:hypothetical protein